MGRPERALDADAGPVQSFASCLRKLRVDCGNPTYRALAKRAHYSHTVLADATKGERLPTLAVALAFVAACGGDTDEWRARWHLCQQQLLGAPSPPLDAPPVPVPLPASLDEPAAGPSVPARAGRRGTGTVRRLAVVAGAVALLAAGFAFGAWLNPAARGLAKANEVSTSRILDGTDPLIANCGPDAIVLDRSQIRLPVAVVIEGTTVAAGTVVGTVSLRYSPRCGGAWARFDPAPKFFGSNPGVAAILLEASRPADGTASTFRLPHVDETYGDLLLTGVGCVMARVTVELSGQPITATAQTRCLPRMS